MSEIDSLPVEGGWPALDFTNTVSQRLPEPGEEYLADWEHYVRWVERLAILPPDEWQQWRRLPAGDLSEALAVREAIDRLFRHYAAYGRIDAGHLAVLNGYLHEVYTHTVLEQLPEGRIERRIEAQPHIEKPLWLLALSAESLLTGPRLPRVKACPSCGWLFLDTSKNGTRRWCSMQTCGSQDKARNYYHRKKGQV
jgi:predicted RNA-binding Zn ribbon-like protein